MCYECVHIVQALYGYNSVGARGALCETARIFEELCYIVVWLHRRTAATRCMFLLSELTHTQLCRFLHPHIHIHPHTRRVIVLIATWGGALTVRARAGTVVVSEYSI